MPSLIKSFPYPFHDRDGQELHSTLCQIYPTSKAAMFVAAKAGMDPAMLNPDQPAYFLWKDILEAAALAGKTGTVIQIAGDQNPGNPKRTFLEALLKEQAAVTDREPRGSDGEPAFI